jgi:hypothetical protein
VTALALVGAALGAVLFAVVWRLSPPTPSPLVQLGRFDARYRNPTPSPGGVHPDAGAEGRRAETWLGRWAAAELGRRGITYTTLRQDLALTGRSFEAVMGRKIVAAVAGFLLALTAMAGLQLTGGVVLPAAGPVVVALLADVGLISPPSASAVPRNSARPGSKTVGRAPQPALGPDGAPRRRVRRAGGVRRGRRPQRRLRRLTD